jgi:RES domain-containing protein
MHGDGRWHFHQTMMVYSSASRSLALLETRVHWNPADSPLLHLFTGEIPNKLLLRIEKSEMPPDWRSHPPPASTREIGTTWFRTRQSVGLLVPSAIIPEEVNCLLNPFHPDFLIDWFSGPEGYSIDPRMVSMPPL